jgi:two-component system sensor histidine kinase KdpD
VPAGAGLTLALIGRPLAPDDRQVLEAFAAQAAGLLKRDELAAEAARAVELAAADRLRNALLAAVGHDLRSPLASASAAVSSLRASDVEWSAQERDDLLATAERSLQRLASLVTDLLDLSRLQAGVLRPATEQVWVEDLIGPALDELGEAANPVRITVPDDLAPACGDAALVLRTLVNLVANAIRHSPPGRPPSVTGEVCAASVRVCVIDHGVGVPAADRDRIFRPFQRLGDTDNSTGLGLGLALSRGFVEAMQGTLEAVDTPGGGLTTIVSLPIWQEEP